MPAAALAGATVVPFDHTVAENAIARLDSLREHLVALRRREEQHASGARINWEGASRTRFDSERGRVTAEMDRAIVALATLVDRIREQQRRATRLQFEADLEEQRARARDLERLTELAARGGRTP